VLGVLVAALVATAYLAVLVTHKDTMINGLRAQVRQARSAASATAATPVALPLPTVSGSTLTSVPDLEGGSLSVVAAAVSTQPGATPLTWLFVSAQHARPGQFYGLLEGSCGGQFVAQTDVADTTAAPNGDLTLVAPNLDISPTSSNVWILVYRLSDGATLGGLKGPLFGTGAKSFRTTPPCS